jgi:ClpP class serine protease
MIEPGYASRMAPLIFRAIEKGTLDQFIATGKVNQADVLSQLYSNIEGQFEREAGPAFFTTTAKNGKKVAIVTMLGAITKNGDACSHGMRDYMSALTAINKRQDISAVVLHFNNAPGGTADGTPELAKFIRSYKKPILSFVDGMAASTHYYFASQADEIMMNKSTPSQVGSIGALMVYQNVQNLIEAGQHPTTEIIRAPQSYNKALLNMVEPMTDSMRGELSDHLKQITKQFIDDVKAGRGDKLANDPELFSGKMYGTTEAIANGLADSKGTLADAINSVAKLQPGRGRQVVIEEEAIRTEESTTIDYMKFPNLSALFGKAETAEQPDAEQASMEAAEAKLAEMGDVIAALKLSNQSVTEKAAEFEQSISALTAQVESLTSENTAAKSYIAELEKKLEAAPAGKATQVVTEGDPEERRTPVSSWEIKAAQKTRVNK